VGGTGGKTECREIGSPCHNAVYKLPCAHATVVVELVL